jgi:hypothetical protein
MRQAGSKPALGNYIRRGAVERAGANAARPTGFGGVTFQCILGRGRAWGLKTTTEP